MQLVAYGAQDIYLTGNPQITFFKVVYRRHTNFSMESIEQTFNGTAALGSKVSATISRNGDLVGKLYVEMDPSVVFNGAAAVPNAPHGLLSEMEVEIGGQRIDKHYNTWLDIWTQLTETNQGGCSLHTDGRYVQGFENAAAGTVPPSAYQRMAGAVKMADATSTWAEKRVYVPLQFWFCRNPGLALPLIALQYHEVKVNITFATGASLSGTAATGSLSSVKLWADYIYLDTDERRRFAQVSHEYLIEQLQYQSEAAGSTFTLNFNHPVKEIIWCGSRAATGNQNGGVHNPYDLCTSSDDVKAARGSVTATIKLNGHERFAPRHETYFTRTQVAQHHSGNSGGHKQDAIHVYSFALKPEEHQPSGTCNFSRIDNAQLVYSAGVRGANSGDGLKIYAVNYNVLRIMSGMGGLAYSN